MTLRQNVILKDGSIYDISKDPVTNTFWFKGSTYEAVKA
jgi:hypothetical protein